MRHVCLSSEEWTDEGMLLSSLSVSILLKLIKHLLNLKCNYFNYCHFKQSYYSIFLILDSCAFAADLLWWKQDLQGKVTAAVVRKKGENLKQKYKVRSVCYF